MNKMKNDPSQAPTIEFAVDHEHAGVRAVGCSTFLIGTAVCFFILNAVFPNGGLIVVGAALAIAVGLTYGADYLAKKYWPSNRHIQFIGDIIQLVQADALQSQIDGGQNVNLLMWHFEAKRHPRVPKGWYVIANALEQDGEYIVTYSIASPDDFNTLPLSRLSTQFQRKKRKRGETRDLRKAGSVRRIEQAEFHRAEFGAEMSLEDYQAYLDYLADTYTSWMPKDK